MKLKFLLLLASITSNATAFFVPTSQSCHHHQHQSVMKPITHVDMIEEESTMVEEEEKRRTNPVGEEETTSSSPEDIDIENIEEELSAALDEFVGFQQTHDAFLKNQQAPVASYPFLKKRKKEEPETNYDYYIPVVSTNQPHANSLFLGDDISDITGLPFVSAATNVASASQQEMELDPFGLEEEDSPTPYLIALNTSDDDDDVVEGYEIAGTA